MTENRKCNDLFTKIKYSGLGFAVGAALVGALYETPPLIDRFKDDGVKSSLKGLRTTPFEGTYLGIKNTSSDNPLVAFRAAYSDQGTNVTNRFGPVSYFGSLDTDGEFDPAFDTRFREPAKHLPLGTSVKGYLVSNDKGVVIGFSGVKEYDSSPIRQNQRRE
ncbi:MAG: hypothetical protein ACI8Y7_001083 [Candidatus Woesearchaeota archaeon]|jgi:hypothetical protein